MTFITALIVSFLAGAALIVLIVGKDIFSTKIAEHITDIKGDMNKMMKFFKKNLMTVSIITYVLLLMVGIAQSEETKRIAELNALEQYVVVEVVDENTAIVESLETGKQVMAEFNSKPFANGTDITGTGVVFKKAEWIDFDHVKAIQAIWG
ncbi:hypothetical protein QTG56_25200 (plasmid) [Rossellomorea sp. AcN35-11]|nr:hypothetical protein [Rossellomorea aquimaris]WJV31932.1 hypothetical protein QTG56_25200 [Rossellomorea sp. AcN35-11]